MMNNVMLKKTESTSDKYLLKWFYIVVLVWLIPSTLLWTGLYLFVAENCDRRDISTLNNIETELENIAYDSSRERFFKKEFSELFAEIKGKPCNPISNVQKLLDQITKRYPKDSIEIYLFNGQGKILPTKNAREEYNDFLNLAKMEFNDESITDEQTKEIGKIIPNPTLVLKKIRDQKNRAIELGNLDKYSLCYFNYESIMQNSVGGILIFVHYNKLKDKVILSKTISNYKNYGYIAPTEIHLPLILKDSEINSNFINDYYKLNPTNRFRRFSKLVCVKRLREHCLLVGSEKISQPSWSLLVISFIIFIIASGFFFNITYKTFVTRTVQSLNTRQRIIWLYAVCYIMPILVGIIISTQYLMELKNSLLSEEKQKNYRRLSEIDSGFSRFTTSKLVEYRKRNDKFIKDVEEPEKIVKELKQLCLDNIVDSVHLISSDSKILVSSALVSSEVRRHRNKIKKAKDEVFETWLGRHALITPIHMKNLYEGSDDLLFPDDNNKTESHKAFIKVIANTTASAMEYYNQSKNITTTVKQKATNLIVGAITEAHSMGLFEAAKSNISKFTPLEAIKEKILAYLDILPGPSGEAWYAYVILTNLECLERIYLKDIFQSIKVGNSRLNSKEINRVNGILPDEDIRAISTYPFATCFPTIKEYQYFEQTRKQSENDSKTFTHEMTINNEVYYVSVLRCSFLKHYLLLKLFKQKDIETIYKKNLYLIISVFIIIMIMGLAFTRIITKNFIMPITDIVNGVNALANKNYDYKIKIRSENEFGVISKAFNDTALTLKKLDINKVIDKYFPLEDEYRCGSYLVYTSKISSNLIASDYFDCIQLKQGTFAIISANITGIDSESTHLMTMLKSAFITLAPNYPNNPEVLMNRLDVLFEPYVKSHHIVSCFIGIFDPTNETMICTNAGQPYPILYDIKRKSSEFINLPSISLGISSNKEKTYRKHEVNLRHKTFVIYSHRVVDIASKNEDDNNFLQIVNNNLKNDNSNPAETLVKALNYNSYYFPWSDDILVVTIQNRI